MMMMVKLKNIEDKMKQDESQLKEKIKNIDEHKIM